MEKRRPIKTNEDLVHAFADLFDEIEPETSEEVDTVLREAGYDPDEVAARMKIIAERAMAESPFNWRSRAQELAEIRARFEDFKDSASTAVRNRADIERAIEQLLARLAPTTRQAFAHRNLESASDEDLAGLLIELEYLIAQQGQPG